MLILGLDLETTSLDVDTTHVTEYGLCLWDTDDHRPIATCSSLVQLPDDFELSPEVSELTGVTMALTQTYGQSPVAAAKRIANWCSQADAIAAHNARNFGKPIILRWAAEQGHPIPNKLWIDTNEDIEVAPGNSSRLVYMAADYGFINPTYHSALANVLTMMAIIEKQNLHELLLSARTPTVTVHALVSFERKDLAKERRYWWDAPSKRWLKNIKQNRVERERMEAPFDIEVLKAVVRG